MRGLVNGLEITVVYTDRENNERRIISAWRSEPRERRYFWPNAKALTDWTRQRRLTPSQIRKGILSDPDDHPPDEKFWKDAKVVLPHRKEVITKRLDADLFAWLRQQQGYQTRINAILRAYMNANIAA